MLPRATSTLATAAPDQLRSCLRTTLAILLILALAHLLDRTRHARRATLILSMMRRTLLVVRLSTLLPFKKTKHILRAAEFLRDLVLRRVFVLKHISGVSNPADVMTKPLPRGTFVSVIDMVDSFAHGVQGTQAM